MRTVQFCLNWKFSHKYVFPQSIFEKLTSVSEVVYSHINQTTVWKPKLWKIKYPKVRKCPRLSVQARLSLLEFKHHNSVCNCSCTAFACRSHPGSWHRGRGQQTSMGSAASPQLQGTSLLTAFFLFFFFPPPLFLTPSLLLHFSASLAFGNVSAGQAKQLNTLMLDTH